MENNIDGFDAFLSNLAPYYRDGDVASIVMNCNPFTKGHLHLINTASHNHDYVHIFILWEDASLFSNEVRYRLLIEGTKHLKNVMVHKATDYIVSSSTFPAYFVTSSEEQIKVQTELDISIFAEHIAKRLNISHRYIGTEPFSPVTNIYNETMIDLLPKYDIEVHLVERLKNSHGVISATKVREAFLNDQLDHLKELVPPSTYQYLVSNEGVTLKNKMKRSQV
jgi:[citrate (pro-3S)-lyase] ligase